MSKEKTKKKWNPEWPSAQADTAAKKMTRSRKWENDVKEALSLLDLTKKSLATRLKNAHQQNGAAGMADQLEEWAKILRSG